MTKTLSSVFALTLIAYLLSSPLLAADAPPIPGADQTDKYIPSLKGKRVGLVANPTSIIDGKPSVDVLLAQGVKVVKIFGPEHGFRNNASAGTVVADEIDAETGIP